MKKLVTLEQKAIQSLVVLHKGIVSLKDFVEKEYLI